MKMLKNGAMIKMLMLLMLELQFRIFARDANSPVIDVTTLSNKEFKNILNSSDRSICAWCFSENSGAVKKAMNNKSSLLSIFTDPLKVK